MPKTIKILTIGDSGVEKSNTLSRYVDDKFSGEFDSTFGLDFKLKTITIDDKKDIGLQLWDTCGQERYRTIAQSYYRGAMGILLIYDITDERSFNNIVKWIGDVDHYSNNIVKILVGNKS